MSQQQTFTGGNSPVIPDIEFIQGTSGGPVGANPATFIINFTSEDLAIDGNPGTFTQHFVDLVKWTPYVVDDTEPAPYTTIQSAIDAVSTYIAFIDFDIDFVALNDIVATVDGVPLTSVVFTVDQATTIAAVAAMIGTATDVTASVVSGARQISVTFATGAAHVVDSVITTLGVSQPIATISPENIAAGQLILVRYGSGNYAENLLLPSNITILSTIEDSSSNNAVLITGQHVPPMSGYCAFVNTKLVHASAILSSAAAGSADFYFKNCNLGITNGFACDLTAWVGTFNFVDCASASVDDGIVNNATGTSAINFNNSVMGGGGQILTTGGSLSSRNSTINCKTDVLGGATLFYTDSYLQGITFNATSSGIFKGGEISGAGVPSITQSSAGTISLTNVSINSNNNPAIDGAGAGVITLAGVPFLNNTVIAGTLTTAVYDWKPYGTQGTSITATNGTASFNEDDFTVVNGFVSLAATLNGTGQTIGAVTDDVFTIPLGAVPGTYKFHFEVAGFDSATPSGLGYAIEASATTDGATALIVSTPDADEDEDPALAADADWNVVVSGNDVILRVTGVVGLTINWGAVVRYVFIG